MVQNTSILTNVGNTRWRPVPVKNPVLGGFILALDSRMGTRIEERGYLLSSAQRRRLQIARAIVSRPKILLLDEPTSALEPKIESFVQASLQKLCKDITTIVVSHNLASIRQADVIVVLEGGKTVETGTHNELMQHARLYKELVDTQRIERSENPAVGSQSHSHHPFSHHYSSMAAMPFITRHYKSILDWETRLQKLQTLPSLSLSGAPQRRGKRYMTPWSGISLVGMLIRVNNHEELMAKNGSYSRTCCI